MKAIAPYLTGFGLGSLIVIAVTFFYSQYQLQTQHRVFHIGFFDDPNQLSPADAKQVATQATQARNPYRVATKEWHEWNRLHGAIDNG